MGQNSDGPCSEITGCPRRLTFRCEHLCLATLGFHFRLVLIDSFARELQRVGILTRWNACRPINEALSSVS